MSTSCWLQKKHPFGLYEDAGYHHRNSVGNAKSGKSPAPADGQSALDCSLNKCKSGDSVQRVGSSCGQFVSLRRTQQRAIRNGRIVDIWHGHVVPWKDLRDDAQTILRENGLVSSKGKIIK